MAGRIDSGDEFEEQHEINVTPFIDVMLVLLIVFMVAAPLATVDVPVDLPTSTATPQARPDKPLFLTLRGDLSVHLAEAPVARANLGAALDAATGGNHDERVFLRADRGVTYGDVVALMNELRGAGYLKIGLVGLETPSAAAP